MCIRDSNELEFRSGDIKQEVIPSARLFPNPTTQNVYLTLEDFQNKDVEIKLLNTLGMEVKNIQLQSVDKMRHEIDLSNFNFGVYHVVIFAEGETPIAKKLLIGRP